MDIATLITLEKIRKENARMRTLLRYILNDLNSDLYIETKEAIEDLLND